MWTVPAQIFWAPTRAVLMAALRSMPGVCAVLPSSWLAGMTRTPSCFHFGSLITTSPVFELKGGHQLNKRRGSRQTDRNHVVRTYARQTANAARRFYAPGDDPHVGLALSRCLS